MSRQKERSKPSFFISTNGEQGISIVLVAVFLVLFIGIAALAVDVGFYMTTKNELQNIADGVALAACRKLGEIYQSMPQSEHETYDAHDDEDLMETVAKSVGTSNKAGGLLGITIDGEDILIGKWDDPDKDGAYEFSENYINPNAINVTARRDNTELGIANGAITTFFARIFNISEIEVEKSATAALTGQAETLEGEVEIPVGISDWFFKDGGRCGDEIIFHPTDESCAGWNRFDMWPASDSKIGNLIDDIRDGDVVSPITISGDTVFNFINGDLSQQTFASLLLLFMDRGYDVLKDDANDPDKNLWDDDVRAASYDLEGNPIKGSLPLDHPDYDKIKVLTDEEGNTLYYDEDKTMERHVHRWDTTVVVYHNDKDTEKCGPPEVSMKVVGYAKVSITDVQDAPNKKIVGHVLCNLISVEPTHGGGPPLGILGSIPNLVE